MQGMSAAGGSFLLDAPSIGGQVAGETEEERRKRLAALQASKQQPQGMSSLAAGYGSALTMS
jgi:hypothetical protein